MACQSVSGGGDTVGSGPIKFSQSVYDAWKRYLERDPITFAVTPDGQGSFYYYCTEVGCQPTRFVTYVLTKCMERYKTPCRLFAMEDQIVWKNPGDWMPSKQDLSAMAEEFEAIADPALHIPEIEKQLSDISKIRNYRNQSGNKALALVFDLKTGKLGAWGTGFKYETYRGAVDGAFNRCLNGVQSRYQFCRIYEVNGVNVWPKHRDDLIAENSAGSVKPPLLIANSAVADQIRDAIYHQPAYRRYLKFPGHKALVAMAPGTNGKVAAWGVSFGHATLEDALKVAQYFCVGRDKKGPRYVGCRVVEANGITLWPNHKDDLTDSQFEDVADYGATLPLYAGSRPITVTWLGEDSYDTTARYQFGLGKISFSFETENAQSECAGDAELMEALGDLEFDFHCDDGRTIQGTGRHSPNGKEAMMTGQDENGAPVEISVGPDPELFP